MGKNSSTESGFNKKLIFIPIGVFAIVLMTLLIHMGVDSCESHKNSRDPIIVNYEEKMTQIINGIEWTIDYNVEEKRVNTKVVDSMTTVKTIKAQFILYENSYQEGAQVRVKRAVTLVGKPLDEKDWYKIEKTEIISNAFGETKIYYDATTRYEERLLFTFPSRPPYLNYS